MSQDQLVRYTFEDAHIRGELVQLSHSYQQIIEGHQYPVEVKQLMGELMAATSLLTATLKFTGDIAVQIQGEGAIKYIAVNGTDQQKLRGVARVFTKVAGSGLQELFPKGHMIITITPEKGERYQGVVGLEKDTIAECLEDYFAQSEQLQTKIYLHANAEKELTAGMLLQVLPSEDPSAEDFDHLDALTQTITADELYTLEANDVLHRLYHQEKVTVYPAQDVAFECGCSREKCATAIKNLGKQEALDIVQEQTVIDMACEYCNSHYKFDAVDVENLFNNGLAGSNSIN